MKLKVNDNNGVGLSVNDEGIGLRTGDVINIGTRDYDALDNKPSINDVTLEGDLSSADIGVADAVHTHVKADITDFAHTHTKSQITDLPNIVSDVKANNVSVVTDGIANLPPLVTDLGNIDPSEYEDDREVFLNTLLDDGIYRFVWEDGDDYELYVVVESMLDSGYVYQKYWCSEEGSKYQFHCTLIVEDDEVVERYEDTYMTLTDASIMFAIKSHTHYDSKNAAMSVFDWCDTSDLTFDNAKPFIIYTDTLNDKNWVIERYATVRQPKYRFIRVYDTSDSSHFYMRSGSVVGNATTWGSWKEYTVTADENVKQQYQAESGYSYWRPLLVGKSAASSEGFTPSTVTDQTYTFKTLEVQPSTGTIRMGVASMFKGSYESKISPTTLTADRTITIPDKSGTLALTSDITGGGMSITVNGVDYPITAITLTTISGIEGVLVDYDDGNSGQLFFADGVGLAAVKSAIEATIPHDTSELTNGAGFLTISDLPIYNGGVS